MNIAVCVSHVPDTTTKVQVAADQKSIDRAGVKFILNPYDEFAVEEALRLRDKHKGEVIIISAGADTVKDGIRQALAMGADRGILVKGETSDSFQVASMLAQAIKPLNADLVLLGKQSIDYDGMQIAPMLSELLGLPSATVVVSLNIEGTTVTAEKEVEGGRETVALALPAIVAAQKGLNEPRYPSLPNIMKAKQKPLAEVAAEAVAARTETVAMTRPDRKRLNKISKVEGDAAAKAVELANLLHSEAKVI